MMSYHGSLCDLYSSTICLKRRRSRSMTLSPLITIFRIRTAGDNIINCSHTETHTKRSNMHWHAGEFQFYITFRDIWWMTGGWMWWRRSQSVGQAVADIRFKLVLIGDVAMGVICLVCGYEGSTSRPCPFQSWNTIQTRTCPACRKRHHAGKHWKTII